MTPYLYAGVFGIVLLAGIVYAVISVRKGAASKAFLFFLDEDGGEILMRRARLNGNEATVPMWGEKRRYVLPAEGRYTHQGLPAWIVHPRHGTSLKAPSDAAIVRGGLDALLVTNPATYYLATARNRPRDSLNANNRDDKWGWVMPVVVGAVCALVLLVIMVGVVLYYLKTKAG